MLNPFNVNYGQSVTVAQFGADFNASTSATPIQDAIDSITDAAVNKLYVINIYPGTYTEDITLKNYVNLLGVGNGSETIISGTNGTLVTCPSTSFRCSNISFQMAPTSSGSIVIDSTAGGNNQWINCAFSMTSATNGITGKIFDEGSSDVMTLQNCFVFYQMTGSSAGVNTHTIVDFSSTGAKIWARVNLVVVLGDVDDNVIAINDASSGQTLISEVVLSLTTTNVAYSGTAIGYKNTVTSNNKLDTRSIFTLTSAGNGIGKSIEIDTATNDGTLSTSSSQFSVTGFTTNYFAEAATGDTINSIADTIEASDNTTGAGVVNFINSNEYGQVQITGGGAYTIDTQNEWHAFCTPTAGLSSSNVDVAQGSTGAITVFADATGGQVTVTSAEHGLAENDYVTIAGTTSYNGVFQVTNVTTDTFEITDTWVANDATGTWHHGSHIIPTRRGAYRIDWTFSCASANVNQIFDFVVFQNTTEISGTQIQRKFSAGGDVGVVAGTGVVFLEKDDHLFFAFRNTSSAGNITISEGALNINKIS